MANGQPNSLNVTVISQYYWPEPFIIHDLCQRLKKLGAEVTVLTGQPNYPQGETYDGYHQQRLSTEKHDDINIYRVPLKPRGKASVQELIQNYLSFIWNGWRYFPQIADKQRPDVIFCYTPSPVTSVLTAIRLKRRYRCPLVLWVQDLWPESLQATGYIKNKFLLWMCGRLVAWLYQNCDLVLMPSKAFGDPIKRLAPSTRGLYYPNSYPDPGKQAQRTISNNEQFNVVFTGNFGRAQALDTIVSAAQILRSCSSIKITLVGSGHLSDWLTRQKHSLGLDNLYLAGRLPMEEMPVVMANADALLMTLRDETIFSYTIPSKLQAYLAAGRPVIAALNGEGANIVQQSGAGLTCPAEDSASLAAQIQKLAALPSQERDRMGHSARNYYEQHFEMDLQAENLLKILYAEREAQK